MTLMNPMLFKDGYKVGHIRQYPQGTQLVYSNFTARESRIEGVDKVVFFGLQYFIERYLIETWNRDFFQRPANEVVNSYADTINAYLGPNAVTYDHIEQLHSLGYLPLMIKALPEGTNVPLRVPMLVIHNTHSDFGWLVTMMETLLSCSLWQACTSATIARRFRKLVDSYATATSDLDWFPAVQCHDFSMRGMSSLETAMLSGAGHLLSHNGTDTIPAILFLKNYYVANDPIGSSVPATEHSVMCMGGKETEEETYRRLLADIYPSGIVSVVSDTWDFWKVVTETLPNLKDVIMSREGTLVVRPDSGDPVKIICGNGSIEKNTPESKGLIQCLWETFGGTVNSKGYKQLDPHIGAIYGDSITYDRAAEILARLSINGFASTNVVFGVGSYTYQYNTRDTFGFAMKATAGMIDGEEVHIFKDPKTDKGTKRSAKGFLRVTPDLELIDNLGFVESATGDDAMQMVFVNGRLVRTQTFEEIRKHVIAE